MLQSFTFHPNHIRQIILQKKPNKKQCQLPSTYISLLKTCYAILGVISKLGISLFQARQQREPRALVT